MDTLPQDLTQLTPKQQKQCMQFFRGLSLAELRKRQSIVEQQIPVAYAERNTLALQNLQIKQDMLMHAVMSKLD